jgi:hypothetical protein
MQIRYDSTDVTINLPKWGYKTLIKYPFTTTELANKKFAKWDAGANYDKRYLSCSWLLPKTDAETLTEIFRDSTKGRAKTLTFKLGTDSGFFPFGADRGDSGDFQVVLKGLSLPASQGHPADLFSVDASFLFVGSYPSYSLPTQFTEGGLTIGTVGGLRYPESMHGQQIGYSVTVTETENFSAYINDKGESADSYQCELPLTLLGSNMAALIAFLSGASGRATDITITPPANAYLFGIKNGSTDDYVCKWLNDEIEIVHNNYDNFSTSLKFGLNE